MKKHERIESVKFSGHGHYKVTVKRYGKLITATIDDMTIIDDYKDEDCPISRQNDLYDMVIRKSQSF